MKSKKLLLALFVSFLALPVISQSYVNLRSTGYSSSGVPNFYKQESKETIPYKSVTGSPYIYDEMLPVKINDFKDVLVAKYDAYKDLITIKDNDSKDFYLKKKVGNKVKFLKTNEEYQVFNDENKKPSFFKIINHTNEYSLLLKESIEFIGKQKPKNSYEGPKSPMFKREKGKLFFSLDHKNAIMVPRNKKKFSALFKENKKLVESFIVKNKLNHRKQADLIEILNFYTSL